MKIWTLKKIKELILNDLADVNLLNVDTFEIDFFKKADLTDIIIIEYYEGYKNFVNNFIYRGYVGLIIICDFRKGNFFFSPSFRTIVVDVNKLGTENTKELIKFLINLYRTRLKLFDLYTAKDASFGELEVKNKIEVKKDILEILNYSFKSKQNIIMSIPVLEDGRKVTARGAGYIRELNESFFIIEKIRPSLFAYKIKIEEPLTVVFSDKDFFYEGRCRVRNKTDENIFIDIPESVEIERRKYVRVEPNYKNPVKVYVHIPGEENEIIDCLEISITGASIISQRDLPVNGVYTFGIKTPYDDRFIMADGIIRNKLQIDEKFRYGIEFSLTEKDVDIIANYIRKREVEILELLKDN